MPPRKKSNAGTSTRVKSKVKGTLKSIPSLAPEEPNHNNDSFNNGDQSSQITSIMNRKNRLGDLLNDRSKQKQVVPRRSNKRQSRSFEEDEGFKFKRSQEANNIAQVSTPISRLREELIGISDDELAPISFGNGFERKNNKKRYEDDEDDENDDIGGGNALSSPIRSNAKRSKSNTKTISNKMAPATYINEYSSDDFSKPATSTESKLKRRSSYHNRGKRLSSIGNGFGGVPHDTIPPSDYYKLLDNSLPEPHRMRQLLIWCFKKKLDQEDKEKNVTTSVEDKTSINIAKVIKEEIMTDLVNGDIETSWYNKENKSYRDNAISKNKTKNDKGNKLLPNPLNVKTLENIQIYQQKLKELQTEREEWDKSLNNYCKDITLDNFPSIKKDSEIIQQDDGNERVQEILKESLLKNLENSIQEVEDIPNHIENSIDKVFNTAYRLHKGHELIESIQRNQLNGEISSVVKDCMTGREMESTEAKEPETKQKPNQNDSFWPISRSPTTKELLRGIARLDAR
ncbi:hypothetical protein CLIB1423_37S00276 [[Candida] railenensis]|uniref:Kinetochore protein mis13 n=1 Tax=[Candida] railenensis TaxID=45579 RepID=A0A9P0QVK5_9ASCO|nr:hypothetical protein CLIB1423_37S00276 [[Candida] railenensis]